MLMKEGYTQFPNDLLEAIIGSGAPASEVVVFLYIVRKTYGWNKDSDRISTAKFADATGLNRRTIEFAKNRLLERKMIKQIKKGGSNGIPSQWCINSNTSEWIVNQNTLENKSSLVTTNAKPNESECTGSSESDYTHKRNPKKQTKQRENFSDSKKSDVFLPEEYQTPEFQDYWKRFLKLQKEMKSPKRKSAQEEILKTLQKYTYESALNILGEAIQGQWKKIYPSDKHELNIPVQAMTEEQLMAQFKKLGHEGFVKRYTKDFEGKEYKKRQQANNLAVQLADQIIPSNK